MLTPSNVGVLVGGLVDTPEIINAKNVKIYKFRLAVDRAGSESGKNESGYFDVVYFDNGSDNPDVDFIRRQIEANNFKKGTRLHIIYGLRQERWKSDAGENRARVVLVAEAISYASSAPKASEDATEPPEANSVVLPAAW